ncbi:hypothetical protein DXG03_003875 [Asterophora parasitica]|uniref:Uncharacterized protein n=1 Tax=Asterophora parasitica TaxID=117018 RepID=A0A9P7GB43_9AGAR|nr:hypothetical protein DXG03_003875 [Asterophora parasitica]
MPSLRDIFRVDPNTSCNTHDLLECPCDGLAGAVSYESFEGGSDDKHDSDSDIELDRGFVRACEVKPGHIGKMDRAYLQKQKAGLAALGEWKHINCLRASSREDIEDNVLRKLIDYHKTPAQDKASQQPTTQLDKLLSVDLETIAAMDKILTVHDVPGGTISYLFQKSSTTTLGKSGE